VLQQVEVRRPDSRIGARTRDRGTVLMSCAAEPQRGVPLTIDRLGAAAPPGHAAVAFLPAAEHPSRRIVFERAATSAIATARQTHRRVHVNGVPPHVTVRRFGRTDDERYTRGVYDRHLELVATLDSRAMVRSLRCADTTATLQSEHV
jgi:hypothetical protein